MRPEPKFRNYRAPVCDPFNGQEKDEGPEVRAEKGWGREDWMLNGENLCMKILTVFKDECCSMHYHIKKEEIFFVIAGEMVFDWIDTETAEIHTMDLRIGDSVHIPVGLPHRFTGVSNQCVFVECSTHHEDEDSYRVSAGSSQ